MSAPRHFLDLSDFSSADLASILANAAAMKQARLGKPRGMVEPGRPLDGRLLAMIFERPSTRTRVSFDAAIRQMGGQPQVLSAGEMQLGRGETIADTAQVLSRYVDAIMIRCANHATLTELAKNATVPVINGLTDLSHPCQVMADLLTLQEKKGDLKGRTVAWSGDSCNVTTSWIHGAAKFGYHMRIASPIEMQPTADVRRWAHENGASLSLMESPEEAARGADCIVTDTWSSMNVTDSAARHRVLRPYQVTSKLMELAKQDAIFMHCLPAHRGEEVTAQVMDSPASVVFDEAENRVHAQKAILGWCLNGK
ncbi:MAG: ornithine carbamoyltransferase [Aestuariivirgaceae bacterium]|nr:ornithine carbamoyltransferase [Aestuariivirgaceae bacterium]